MIWRTLIGLVLAFATFASSAVAQSTPSSSGTGFFVNAEGWILTNAHVLEQCDRISVAGIGDTTDVKIDRQNDLAAIKVPGHHPFLSFHASRPRLGEDIVAFGFPLSGILSDSIKVTTGNINSLVGLENDTRFLQVSTQLHPGNSGGPVVDRSGALVGIATAVLGSRFADATGVLPQNLNFSIRSNVAELFLEGQGIAYRRAGENEKEALPTADLSDAIAPSVVQVLCFGSQSTVDVASPSPPSPTPSTAPSSFAGPYVRADNYDVIGHDYRTLPSVSEAQCQQACENDRSCRASTYNKPQRYCFLKNDAGLLVANSDAVAHVASELVGEVVISTFTVATGRDMAGGDYRRIRQSTFTACYLECEIDTQCRAFAFVRNINDCWLKNQIGRMSVKPGVELGLR